MCSLAPTPPPSPTRAIKRPTFPMHAMIREDDLVLNDARPFEEEFSTYTLYLIRHGEAAHNILEKAAKKKALEEAIAEGYGADSDEARRRMEEARRGVLHDVNLFDAPLSQLGRSEAKRACQKMKELQETYGVPTEVLVSPLQRTLETADLIFPNCNNIRVREELRERQTGKPPDTRSPSALLRRRPTFQRFSMFRLRISSLANVDGVHGHSSETASAQQDTTSCKTQEAEEDKHMLRGRTEKLFSLIAESKEKKIAVVTHKGYLRELERGPFGNPDAAEFKNCEVRVYKATFLKGQKVLYDIKRVE